MIRSAFALLLLLVLPPQDKITLTSGRVLSGEITQAGIEKVVINGPEGQESLETGKVLAIDYGDEPEALSRARAFLKQMDYQNAVASYEAAASDGDRAWVAEMAGLGRADALLAWARVDPTRAAEAVQAYQDWLAAHPDSFHQIDARIGLGRALSRAGKADDGARVLEQLSSLAFEKNLGRHVELAAHLERAIVYLEGGQAQVAETRLRDLVPNVLESLNDPATNAGVKPALRGLLSRAQIALGDAIEAKSGTTAARAYWEGLQRDRHSTVDVRAAAAVGVARQAIEAGSLREAQLQLSEVVATMNASPEVMARALYRLGEVTASLGNDLGRAEDYFQQIIRRYPGTTWAVKARSR